MRRWMAVTVGLLLIVSISAAENRGPALVGYLVLSEGQVQLKRPEWSHFHSVRAGARLELKDQLRLADDALALVLCVDFETTWPPTRGERSIVSQGCKKPSRPLLELPDGLVLSVRGQEISEHIRSPRGAIREPAPRIRWESFGAQEYQVQVSLGRRPIWGPVLVAGTEQDIPPGFLEPEKPYRLQLRPVGISQFVEPVIGFHVIAENQRSKIATMEKTLLSRFYKERKEKQLAHVLYLAHKHLWDEALTILDTILPELDSAASELWGANLALGLGFQHRALERYEKARQLAETQEDLESGAEALVGMARLADKRELREALLRAAMTSYAELGDQKRVEDLRRDLVSLP